MAALAENAAQQFGLALGVLRRTFRVQIDAYLAADLAGRTLRMTPLRMGHHRTRGISTTRGRRGIA